MTPVPLPSGDPIDWPAFIARVSFRSMFPVRLRFVPAILLEGGAVIVTLCVPDIHNGTPSETSHRVPLYPTYCPVNAVAQLRGALQTALLHEADECMLFDGRQIRDPHASESTGRRLVDHGVTPLLDDSGAIDDLRRTVKRRIGGGEWP